MVALLASIAVLMTAIIYVPSSHCCACRSTRDVAAFTFPMVIGATALYKLATQLEPMALDAAVFSWCGIWR